MASLGNNNYYHTSHTLILSLQIPSEREVPIHRKLQLANKRAARGGVTKYAHGSYTQTFGVIKQSDLHALKQT